VAGRRVRSTGIVFLVSPGKEVRRVALEVFDVLEHPCQVIERIDPCQLTRMDEAHEEVPHVCPVLSLVEEGVFPMEDGIF